MFFFYRLGILIMALMYGWFIATKRNLYPFYG